METYMNRSTVVTCIVFRCNCVAVLVMVLLLVVQQFLEFCDSGLTNI
jgi:hypothetical protein